MFARTWRVATCRHERAKLDLRDVSRAASHALRHEPCLYELELDTEEWIATDVALSGRRRPRGYRRWGT
jgi:RNA:NAD 2'-phosphotransferase (TPT1/KptA family)